MQKHTDLSDVEVRKSIRQGNIVFAGNRRLKIYGTLACASGKRMKRSNRVFFTSRHEAVTAGYRPCAHCLRSDYKNWSNGFI
jgi:methylphosphotriester-DNA--protein-cysteine methyltransferase